MTRGRVEWAQRDASSGRVGWGTARGGERGVGSRQRAHRERHVRVAAGKDNNVAGAEQRDPVGRLERSGLGRAERRCEEPVIMLVEYRSR